MLDEDLPMKVVRTTLHDEFRRLADECRRLAASARNAKDRAFWLGLVERWQALEGQAIRQPAPPCPPPRAGRAEWGSARHSEASPTRLRQAPSIDVLASNGRNKSVAPAAVGGRAAGAASRPAKRREPF